LTIVDLESFLANKDTDGLKKREKKRAGP